MDLQLKRLCFLFLICPLVGLAQDQAADTEIASEAAALATEQAAEIESMEPSATPDDLATARDEINPAVPTAVLAADVRRSAAGNEVMDTLDLGLTEITGNQELPKVLYIVPWRKSDPGDLMGRPVNTLLDEVMAPIDRSEFMRQVDYYGDLHQEEQE